MDIERQVRNVVCVGSMGAGVGKSSLVANLAAGLRAGDRRVGLLDADLWRASIPAMVGAHGRPTVSVARKVVPLEDAIGVKVISIEFFLDTPEQEIDWRGPMVKKAIRQFVEDVEWGELDYLLVDLPPGAGEVSKAIAELAPAAMLLLVTTSHEVAQRLARGSLEPPDAELDIVGVVENMSGFTAPSGEHFAIFGPDGGSRLADKLGCPLLGRVPMTLGLREQPTAQAPLLVTHPADPAAQPLREVCGRL